MDVNKQTPPVTFNLLSKYFTSSQTARWMHTLLDWAQAPVLRLCQYSPFVITTLTCVNTYRKTIKLCYIISIYIWSRVSINSENKHDINCQIVNRPARKIEV